MKCNLNHFCAFNLIITVQLTAVTIFHFQGNENQVTRASWWNHWSTIVCNHNFSFLELWKGTIILIAQEIQSVTHSVTSWWNTLRVTDSAAHLELKKCTWGHTIGHRWNVFSHLCGDKMLWIIGNGMLRLQGHLRFIKADKKIQFIFYLHYKISCIILGSSIVHCNTTM